MLFTIIIESCSEKAGVCQGRARSVSKKGFATACTVEQGLVATHLYTLVPGGKVGIGRLPRHKLHSLSVADCDHMGYVCMQ